MAGLAIVPLGQVESVRLIGGKARALSQLVEGHFNVPPGFVVTSEVFDDMTPALQRAIFDSFDALSAQKVAVRSSAASEDGAKDAWAGQMNTYLNINRGKLIGAVRKCWQSAGSPRAIAYAKQKGLKAGPMAVIVQAMTQGDVSGVAFSVHPVTQNQDHMVIEAVAGLAEALVSGVTTPASYVISRRTGKIIESHEPSAERLLSERQVTEVAKTVGRLEQFFGFPVDVEWTFSGDKLFILQSRPITTLG